MSLYYIPKAMMKMFRESFVKLLYRFAPPSTYYLFLVILRAQATVNAILFPFSFFLFNKIVPIWAPKLYNSIWLYNNVDQWGLPVAKYPGIFGDFFSLFSFFSWIIVLYRNNNDNGSNNTKNAPSKMIREPGIPKYEKIFSLVPRYTYFSFYNVSIGGRALSRNYTRIENFGSNVERIL